MEQGVFGKKIIQLYNEGNLKTLETLIRQSLNNYRETTLGEVRSLLPGVAGKLRLKLLEILMDDGGEDLIDLFTQTISQEKNSLYAKSMLLVYGHFTHQQALISLMELAPSLSADLKTTYQRVISRFQGQFREFFYMSEFESGIYKRMKFAANIMLKEPHPRYIPFLNKQLMSNSPDCQLESVKALRDLGDQRSLEAVFAFFESVLNRHESVRFFHDQVRALMEGSIRPVLLVHALAEHMGFTADTLDSLYKQALKGPKQPFINAVLKGAQFDTHPVASSEVTHFLEMLLQGSQLEETHENRLQTGLQVYRDHLFALLENSLETLGTLGLRLDHEELPQRVEDMLPTEFPNRQKLVLRVYRGFTSENSKTRLLNYLNSLEDPEILAEILTVLLGFEHHEIPAIVDRLVRQTSHRSLRTKALKVVGQWGLGDHYVPQLQNGADPTLRQDIVRMLRDFAPPEGKAGLQALLKKTNGAELLEVIKALSAYPSSETGEAMMSLVDPAQPYDIRQAAIQTIIRAGGNQRMERLHQVIQNYKPKKRNELLDTILGILKNTEVETYEESLLDCPPLGEELLSHPSSKVREAMLRIFEDCQWQNGPLEEWVTMLEKLITTRIESRGNVEEQRLKQLFLRLEQRQKRLLKQQRAGKILNETLEHYHLADDYHKAQSLRRLSMIYKADTELPPAEASKLLAIVKEILSESQVPDDLRLLGIGLAGKIGHPDLLKAVERHLNHGNGQIAKAAREVILNYSGEPEGDIRSIFVLDDSRYMTNQLSALLIKSGYQVAAENRVREALKALFQDQFDLMILDLEMPEMDGLQFLQAAREAKAAPDHVLVITANRDADNLQRVANQGIGGVFLKPFPMQELLQKIKTIEAA